MSQVSQPVTSYPASGTESGESLVNGSELWIILILIYANAFIMYDVLGRKLLHMPTI